MKGKGKGKSEVKVKTEAVYDLPVKAPEFSIADINNCPIYAAGVKKESKGVPFKDLVGLQYELEYMQVCMLRRQEQLKVEISSLENPAAKRNKRSRSSDSVGKNAKKSKKCKGNNGKKASTPCRPKNKFVQPPPRSYECGVTDAQVEPPKPLKNDGPSRFWSFIDPYCADITEDDVKSIENWIKTHEEDSEYQKIPELGNHFAEQWPKDEMNEELKEGSKSVENQKGSFDLDSASLSKEKILKLGERECKQLERKSNSHQNTLVKRLVSTLVQENVMTPLDVCLADSSKDETARVSKPKVPSKSNSPSKESLHKKLCRGLNEIGALEYNEPDLDESQDEILAELKRLQKALIPVCNRNLRQKKHLLAIARAEIKKQDFKKKLKEIDAKLMEIYREIYAARCENRDPPRKYAAPIRKTISERQMILKQLEDMT